MLRVFLLFVLIAAVSATENDRCQGPPTADKCRVHTVRWFYNDSSATCQPFICGGCNSNGNNFMTQCDCTETCINSIVGGPGVKYETFTCALSYENGFKIAETGRLLCECAEPTGCSATRCTFRCEYGLKRDDRGRNICECHGLSQCPDVSCNMLCPFGFKWKHGCQTCECNRHMCETLHCGIGEVCLVPVDDCSSLLCASDAKCVPATDLDQEFGREEISFEMFIRHPKNVVDVDTELLKWYVRKRLAHSLQLHPNCIEHLQVRTVKMARLRIRFELAKDKGCRPRNVALRLLSFMHTSGHMKFRGVIFENDPRSLQADIYFDGWPPRQIIFTVSYLVFTISFVLLISMLVINYLQQRDRMRRRGKSPMI